MNNIAPEQRRVHDKIVSGPRGAVQGPLRVWLQSAEMADRAQALGAKLEPFGVKQVTEALVKGTALGPVLEGAFRKMMAGLDDSVKYSLGDLDGVVSIRPSAPGDADLEKFQLFTRAISFRSVRVT